MCPSAPGDGARGQPRAREDGGPELPPYDAAVLAGGRARRLGGLHKPGVEVGGRSVLWRVTDAVPDAGRLVVVGPSQSLPPGAVATRESEPGSGPVPALRAALRHVSAPWLALLAADLPFLRLRDIADLRGLAVSAGGAVLTDGGGHEQWLIGVWDTTALGEAVAGYDGGSLRGLLGPLRPVRHAAPVSAETPPPWLDCDTMEDIEFARRWA